MNDSFDQEKSMAYGRMLAGAIVGFSLFGELTAFSLWIQGWFDRVPMFTPPPGRTVMLIGSFGCVVGALAGLLSRNWKKIHNHSIEADKK